ncbi:class I lanthipeptide [Acidobacteriota bacterium]
MKPKKLNLKKATISNLNPDQLNSIKGGWEITDYCRTKPDCGPDNQTLNC